MWQPLPMMKWHLSHLHWHISNQDNDRHGPHTDTGLVRIHFFTSCKHRHKKVLFLHKQTTGKKTCFAGALFKWGVMMAPPKMSELKLCVSQGGFLCVLVLCAFPGYVWKLYVMLPEPLFHNLSLTNCHEKEKYTEKSCHSVFLGT